jgi:hypothetical protein
MLGSAASVMKIIKSKSVIKPSPSPYSPPASNKLQSDNSLITPTNHKNPNNLKTQNSETENTPVPDIDHEVLRNIALFKIVTKTQDDFLNMINRTYGPESLSKLLPK